jgi:hypothetical protein
MGKKIKIRIRDEHPSLETIFWVKNTLILWCGGMEKFGSGIQHVHPGSATLLIVHHQFVIFDRVALGAGCGRDPSDPHPQQPQVQGCPPGDQIFL